MKTFTLALPTSIVFPVSTHPTSVTNWRYNCIEPIPLCPYWLRDLMKQHLSVMYNTIYINVYIRQPFNQCLIESVTSLSMYRLTGVANQHGVQKVLM